MARVIAPFGAGDHEAVVNRDGAAFCASIRTPDHALRYRAASLALLGRIEEAREGRQPLCLRRGPD